MNIYNSVDLNIDSFGGEVGTADNGRVYSNASTEVGSGDV